MSLKTFRTSVILFAALSMVACTNSRRAALEDGQTTEGSSSSLTGASLGVDDVAAQYSQTVVTQAPQLPGNLNQPPPLTLQAQGCLANPLAEGCIEITEFEDESVVAGRIREEFLRSLVGMRQCFIDVVTKELAPDNSSQLAQQLLESRKSLVACAQSQYNQNMLSLQWQQEQFIQAQNNFYYWSYLQSLGQ